jgi:putative transposase
VRHLVSHGLSERRSLRIIGMSASAYRYEPTEDRNCALKEKIIALAQRHRRYGAGMIYLQLRQAGEIVNHKRVDRLYAEAGLQVMKRRSRLPTAIRWSALKQPIRCGRWISCLTARPKGAASRTSR